MQRDRVFDVARGLAMLYIIGLWHMSSYSGIFEIPYGDYIKNAALGLFMFLSGYLLGAKYIIRNVKDGLFFLKKRFLRLYPLYALSLLLFYLHSAIDPHCLIFSLVGLSTFIPPQPPTLWFVSLLLVFYLIFMPISCLKRRDKVIAIAALYVVFIVVCSFLKGVDYRILFYFPSFFGGVIISDMPKEKLYKDRITIVSLLLFVCLIVVANSFNLGFIGIVLIRAVVALCGALLILNLSKHIDQYIGKLFIPISYASMAAYLFHRQVISAIRMVYWPEPSVWRVLYLVLFCVPLVLLLGYVIQRVYDWLLKKIENASIIHRK